MKISASSLKLKRFYFSKRNFYSNLLCLFFLSFANILFAGQPYPRIENLEISDPLFRQYSDDVLNARKAIAAYKTGKDLPIFFYVYAPKKDDTILTIAARCSIPYDAIITLNRIDSADFSLKGRELILPSMPAVYLPEDPSTPLEKLIAALFEKSETEAIPLKIHLKKKKQSVFCFANGLLDGTIRAFFFRPFYRFPLQDAVLTSGFGKRPSPFTGKPSYHPGIDLAAPTGSPVMACAAGKVKTISYNRVYGKYIIIAHKDGRASLYGHLSKIYAEPDQKVKAGTVIGAVGSTGMSTGPHLHFEIREHGVPKNPTEYIDKKIQMPIQTKKRKNTEKK